MLHNMHRDDVIGILGSEALCVKAEDDVFDFVSAYICLRAR
jgi:hypothetical protein